ncbi:MAG: ORF6N domain-containing protein [Deltaproteobacteria bacterium]|nr:ORF6N domain-containing protein [Deltaproteobacteria bacterium]
MAEELATYEAGDIGAKIHTVRGHKVILDSDLAEMYGVTTKRLNEQVRRNEKRFPAEFMFRLTLQEWEDLRSQNATSSLHGGRRYLPHVFTEHGAVMAANILTSERAIQMSICVVRAFLRLRDILSASLELAGKLQELETRIVGHDESIELLFKAIRALMQEPEKPRRQIGFTAREKRAAYRMKQ